MTKKVLLCLLLALSSANSFYLQNISLKDYAKIVSDSNNINIYIDEDINTSISFYIPDYKEDKDLLATFERTLNKQDLYLLNNGNYYSITRKQNLPNEYRYYNLKYATIKDIESILKSFNVKYSYLADSNKVLIYCNDDVFTKLHKLISLVDVEPEQIVIKFTFLEIDNSELNERGVEWGYKYNNTDGFSQSVFNLLFNPTSTGQTPIVGSQQYYATLKLLDTDDITNIKQYPYITAKHNQKFKFEVVENVPYLVTTTNVENANTSTQQSVEYKDVGLKVNGQVKIYDTYVDIDLELITAELVNELDTPSTLKRLLQTNVKLPYNDILVLSGLQQTIKKDAVARVPVLSNIPYLGELFKYYYTDDKETTISIGIQVMRDNQVKILKENLKPKIDYKVEETAQEL